MHKQSGFTLVEILVVVALVGILSAIAVPMYGDYVTRSKISEAIAQLSDMRVKMEQFFLDNRTYQGACATGTVAPLPVPPQVRYFTYTCPTLQPTTYSIVATGNAAEGMGDFIYSIDQNNTRATQSVPSGWTQTTTCWTIKKDGSC